MECSSGLIDIGHRGAHVVHIYEPGDRTLGTDVAQYFFGSLASGGCAICVATPAHHRQILTALDRLPIDVDALIANNRYRMLDASSTLDRFMVRGTPDRNRFFNCFEATIAEAAQVACHGAVRIYGEMVAELWQRAQSKAALQLEQLWNELQAKVEFHLYCAYEVDVFDENQNLQAFDDMLCAHTHLIPADSGDRVAFALQRAMHDVLGTASQRKPPSVQAHRHVWAALPRGSATLATLRELVPSEHDKIRALARKYYEQAAS